MRIIYYEQGLNRFANCYFISCHFLYAGLAWMLAVSAIPRPGNVPFSSEGDFPLVLVLFLAGWLFLYLGLRRMFRIRIAADDSGLKLLGVRSRWLFQWADVRSWRLEFYQSKPYDADGQGGITTGNRLVVELESTANPLVVEHAWHAVVLAELSAVVPMRRSQEAELKRSAIDQGCVTRPDPMTHGSFRWVEDSEGYRLDLPLPDGLRPLPPRFTVKLSQCLATLGGALVLGILVATVSPFGDRTSTLGTVVVPVLWALVIVGGLSLLSLFHNERCRSVFNRCIAWLHIGPEFAIVVDGAGHERKWRRAQVNFVRVDCIEAGNSEGGGGDIHYVVVLDFQNGSSLSVLSVSRGGEVAWLARTLRQVLGLPATRGGWNPEVIRRTEPCPVTVVGRCQEGVDTMNDEIANSKQQDTAASRVGIHVAVLITAILTTLFVKVIDRPGPSPLLHLPIIASIVWALFLHFGRRRPDTPSPVARVLIHGNAIIVLALAVLVVGRRLGFPFAFHNQMHGVLLGIVFFLCHMLIVIAIFFPILSRTARLSPIFWLAFALNLSLAS